MKHLLLVLCFAWVCATSGAQATWKPEYGKTPSAVQQWFSNAEVKGGCKDKNEAYAKLGVCRCCEQAERLRTKFIGTVGGEWSYYPDPDCVVKGCKLLPIPDYVVHEDEIHAASAEDDALPEFEAMRKEGVLFIYKGVPSCFWPPKEGGI